jgi:hypothetical protein
VITRFPADELLVAGRTYVRGADLIAKSDDDRHDDAPGIAAAVAPFSPEALAVRLAAMFRGTSAGPALRMPA